jgi:hypothetical protein
MEVHQAMSNFLKMRPHRASLPEMFCEPEPFLHFETRFTIALSRNVVGTAYDNNEDVPFHLSAQGMGI